VDKISNEEVVQKVNQTKTTLDRVRKRDHVWFGHMLRHEPLLHGINRGKNEGEGLVSDLMKEKFVALKRTAEDRTEWQKLLRAGSHTPASQQIT